MGQYRTDLLWGKPSAAASSNSPVCCKGTSHTMPIRIAGGEIRTFLHVNLHLNTYLVSFVPNERFFKAPLSITTIQRCLWDQFLFRTVTTGHPSALLPHMSPPAVYPHLGSSALQSMHAHGGRAEELLYPMQLTAGQDACQGVCIPGALNLSFLCFWTHIRCSTTFSNTVQCFCILVPWSLNVGSSREQWLF